MGIRPCASQRRGKGDLAAGDSSYPAGGSGMHVRLAKRVSRHPNPVRLPRDKHLLLIRLGCALVLRFSGAESRPSPDTKFLPDNF